MTRHPELHLVHAVCASCGAEFDVRSTAERLPVEVCSSCHPAYTGRQSSVVRGDRIERFNRRRSLAASASGFGRFGESMQTTFAGSSPSTS